MKKSLIIIVLLSSLLALFNGPTSASQATAKSIVDLSSILNISGLSVSWGLNDPASFANATANPLLSDFQSLSSYPAGTGYGAQAAVSANLPYSATATGTVFNPSTTTLKLGVVAQSGPVGYDMPTATASAAVSMTYTYTGADAEILFAIPYMLNLSLLSSNIPSMSTLVYGFSSLDFIMTKGATTFKDQVFYINATKENGQFLNFPDAGDLSKGTDTFFVNFSNGDTGTFDFRTYATTSASADFSINEPTRAPAVPIPGAIWLLGTGLVGLAGMRRFQNR